MQSNINSNTLPISKFLVAGLIAGIIAAVIANIVYAIYSGVSGYSFTEVNIFSITLASIIPNLIGGLIYYALTRRTRQPNLLYAIIVIGFGILSAIPQFISPMYPHFAEATAPLHLIVAVVSVLVIPTWVKSQR
jgi:peptidoglycan/LPS O-acetylase OafA/YrhL